MKKVVSLIITILFGSLSILTVYAVNTNTYQIDELDMSIDIPTEYVVFTRDMESDDLNLETYGLTKDELLYVMEAGNIYMSILDKDNNFEILITMVENDLEDLNEFDDTAITALVSLLKEEYEKLGVIIDRYDVYQHSQAKFVKIYQSSDEGTIFGLQYYTIYANKAINITMKSYSDKINLSEESIMKQIIDNMHFRTEVTLSSKMAESEKETTESFIYKDDETGVEFIVPSGQPSMPSVGAYSNRTNELDLGRKIENFFLNLLFTVVIYSLPITIYRYAIRKKPFGKVKAIIITIIYGIVSFSVTVVSMTMISISGAFAGKAILFWAIINYKMLSTD